jgi:hypothetical protein
MKKKDKNPSKRPQKVAQNHRQEESSDNKNTFRCGPFCGNIATVNFTKNSFRSGG